MSPVWGSRQNWSVCIVVLAAAGGTKLEWQPDGGPDADVDVDRLLARTDPVVGYTPRNPMVSGPSHDPSAAGLGDNGCGPTDPIRPDQPRLIVI